MLEYLRIPYTHSGVLASALAMDKQKTKAVLRLAGLNCPDGLIASRFDAAREHLMPAPYVAKPNDQGSSVGVLIVREGANRPPAELAADSWPYGDEILIEKIHSRPGADRRRDGRPRADRHRDRAEDGLLRL